MQRTGRAALFASLMTACGCGARADLGAGPAGSDAGDGDRDIGADLDASLDGADASEAASDAGDEGDAGDAADADAAMPVGDPICTPRSGTRIKVRWYQSAEGTRVFDSMYDSMLGVRCAPGLTSDGKVRCVPLEQYGGTPTTYADAQCTTLVESIADDCDVPAYLTVYGTAANAGDGGDAGDAGACVAFPASAIIESTPFSIYRVDAAQPDGGAGFQMSGGTCVPAAPPPGHVYAITPVADATFVEGTVGQVTAGRYSMATVDFSDGAHYCESYGAFYDSTLDLTTDFVRAADHTLRLVPAVSYTYPSYVYADSTCTTPVVGVTSTCDGLARFALEEDCASLSTVNAVGPAVDAGFQLAFAPDGGLVCDPLPPGFGTWNAVAAPVPFSTFGEVVRHATGAGRLQELTYEAEGQFRWRKNAAFDTQNGMPCLVAWIPGDTTRCLPTPGPIAVPQFSDSDCTQPLYLVSMPSSCAAPSATAIALSGECRPKIVHVGAAYSGNVYQRYSDGTCVPQSPSAGSVVYRGIDDIDPATYPELTAVIE